MANKQDLKGALTAAQISDGLGLTELKDREWQILATSALTGQGELDCRLLCPSKNHDLDATDLLDRLADLLMPCSFAALQVWRRA